MIEAQEVELFWMLALPAVPGEAVFEHYRQHLSKSYGLVLAARTSDVILLQKTHVSGTAGVLPTHQIWRLIS